MVTTFLYNHHVNLGLEQWAGRMKRGEWGIAVGGKRQLAEERAGGDGRTGVGGCMPVGGKEGEGAPIYTHYPRRLFFPERNQQKIALWGHGLW